MGGGATGDCRVESAPRLQPSTVAAAEAAATLTAAVIRAAKEVRPGPEAG